MQLRQAALTGRIMVIVHLALTLAINFNSLARYGEVRHEQLGIVVQMTLGIVATIVLDVALLLVFSSLARTSERQLYDSPDNTTGQMP
jgi:heme/copper-type cytochrome/quinol oxidase subunit 2